MAGDRFWIRPSEDKVFTVETLQCVIALAWKLRPGQKAPAQADDPIGIELSGSGPGFMFVGYSPAKGIATGTEGTVEGTFSFDFQGEGEVILYLVGQGRKPLSNLLRLKVKSGG